MKGRMIRAVTRADTAVCGGGDGATASVAATFAGSTIVAATASGTAHRMDEVSDQAMPVSTAIPAIVLDGASPASP